MVMSVVLSFFPRGVLDEILNLIESVSEEFPSYSNMSLNFLIPNIGATNVLVHSLNYAITIWGAITNINLNSTPPV